MCVQARACFPFLPQSPLTSPDCFPRKRPLHQALSAGTWLPSAVRSAIISAYTTIQPRPRRPYQPLGVDHEVSQRLLAHSTPPICLLRGSFCVDSGHVYESLKFYFQRFCQLIRTTKTECGSKGSLPFLMHHEEVENKPMRRRKEQNWKPHQPKPGEEHFGDSLPDCFKHVCPSLLGLVLFYSLRKLPSAPRHA